MNVNIEVQPQQIIEHLLLPYCSILRNAVKIDVIGNSVVYANQWFPFLEATAKCFPNIPLNEIKLGLNFVQIQGTTDEDLHVHISYLIGIVVEGKGLLRYKKRLESLELTEVVNAGDIIFVPRNTLHYFEGLPVIRFAALEFGPLIDYQKHYYEEINEPN